MITSFLSGRSHITKTIRGQSRPLPINLSIVQGSGIGPTLYITMESDLIPLSNLNIMFKYAFLCRNVQMFNFKLSLTPFKVNWAAMKKTKEIVFHRPILHQWSLT